MELQGQSDFSEFCSTTKFVFDMFRMFLGDFSGQPGNGHSQPVHFGKTLDSFQSLSLTL